MKFLVIFVQIFFLVHPYPGSTHYLLEVVGGKRYLVENGSNNNIVQNIGKIHLHNGGKNHLLKNGGRNSFDQNRGRNHIVENGGKNRLVQHESKNYLVQNEDKNYLVQTGEELNLVEEAQNASSPNENLHNKA